MNTPLLIPSANIANKNTVFLTGPALSDTAVWFASANKEYLTIPSNASLQTGDISYEFADWLRFDTVGTVDWVVGKDAEWKIDMSSNILRFGTYASGAWTYVSASTFGALSTATWYFVRVWRDNTPVIGNNLLANGDFETDGVGGADVFGSWGENAASGTIEKRTDSVHSGTAALKLASIPASGYPNVLSPHITVVPGKSYRLKVWSAGDGVHSGRGRIYDNIHSSVLYEITDMGNVTSEYQLYEYTFTAPAGCSDIQIYLFSPFAATSYASYDDISLTEMISGTINISVNNGVANSASAAANTAGSNPLVFGKGTGYYNGRMDSAYWTKTLSTAGYATTLYNSGLGFTSALAQHYLPTFWSNCISWWDFNSESGTQYDSKGSNHLTATADPIISPTINNGGFEDWTTPTNAAVWSESVAGSSTVNQETTAPYSGNSAVRLDVDSGGYYSGISQILLTAGKKYNASIYAKASSNGQVIAFGSDTGGTINTQVLTTSYTLYSGTFVAGGTGFTIKRNSGTSFSAYIDNVTLTSIGPTAEAGITAGNAVDGNFGAGFNGLTQSLSKVSNADMQQVDADYTLFGWFNFDVLAGNLLTKLGEYVLYYDSGTSKIIFSAYGSTQAWATGPVGTAVNNWYFIEAGYAKSTGRIFIAVNNGTPSTIALTGTPVTNSNVFSVGLSNYKGKIDGVGRINRALTSDERAAIYNNGKGLKYSQLPSSIKNDPLLKAYWNLDEKSGTRYDSTSNGNDLTDNNSVTQVQGVNYFEGSVSRLQDLTANLSHFNQVTLAKRPVYDSMIWNGKGGILFDGVDDGLVKTGDVIGVGDVTLCAVIKARGWGGGNAGRIIDNGPFLLKTDLGQISATSNGSTTAVSSGSSISLNVSYIITVTRTSAGVVNIYINGVLSGTANQSSGTPVAGSDTYIGNRAAGDRAFDGHIGRVAVINRILSIGEIQAVSRRLSVEYGGIY